MFTRGKDERNQVRCLGIDNRGAISANHVLIRNSGPTLILDCSQVRTSAGIDSELIKMRIDWLRRK
jgi:hypothetical protein